MSGSDGRPGTGADGTHKPPITATDPGAWNDDWHEDPGAVRRHFLAEFGPLLALAGVWLLFGIGVAIANHNQGLNPWSFFAPGNQALILAQTVVVGIGALGMTMLIVGGGIDLSCGSSIALSAVVAAVVLHAGGAGDPGLYAWLWPLVAVAAAVATGALVGLVNGAVIAGGGLMPFIATLGMLGVARGLAKALAGEQTVNFPATWLTRLMRPTPFASDPAWQRWLLVAGGIWIAALLAAVMVMVMRRSVFGRHLYALGSNEAAARLCGIRVRAHKVTMYALAGAFFGLAGLFSMARLGQGDPTTAAGLELDIIAAVVIGGASLSGGTGSIAGSLVGALIMAVLRNGSQQLGWPTYMQEIIIGAVIVVAVWLDRLRQRRAA